AVVVRLVGSFWSGLDPDVVAAASTLGASPWQRFRRVTLPLSVPAIASAASVVFLFTFTSLGVVLILGGPGLTTLEVEILRQTRDLLNLPSAAALALVQLGAVGLALLLGSRLQQRAARTLPRHSSTIARRPLTTTRDRQWLAGNLGLMAVLLGTPIAVLVVRSLRVGEHWSLASWTQMGTLRSGSLLAVSPLEAFGNTLWFGLQATVLATVLGVLASVALANRRGRRVAVLDALLALPLGTSAVTVGFGFLVALNRPPLDLRSSAILVPIAHALVATPFVVRVVLPAVRALDPDQRAAARTLGAGPLTALLRTDVRTLAAPISTAAAFAFAISAGEFGATVFIARPESTTAPLMILRLLSQPGTSSLGQAMALSVLLLVVVTAVILTAARGASQLDRVPA
ncbi:MAG: thiamine transport system permease protein, partial [Glaciecola sp.]